MTTTVSGPGVFGTPPDHPPSPRLIARNRTVVWAAILACSAAMLGTPVAVTLVLGAVPYEQIRVGFPGSEVGVATAIANAAADASGVIAVGALVTLLFLRETPRRRARTIDGRWELVVLQSASAVWALSSAAMVFLESFDANGAPFSRLLVPGAMPFLYEASDAAQAWTFTALAATMIFLASLFVRQWTGLLVPLWLAFIGILAPVVTGQVLVGPDHDFGGDAAALQTLGTTVLFGACLLVATRVATGHPPAPEFLRRILLIAVVALPLIITTELVVSVFKLAGRPLLASPTGWMMAARWISLLIVVATIVALARLWRTAKVRARHITASFLVLTVGITGWTAVTVAMTRQPPPQYFVPTSIEQVLMGFDVPDAPSLGVLFGQWRPNILFLALAMAASAVYLVAVRSLRRRGDSWSPGRTAAWLGGWGLVVFATSSGFGKYSASDFGIHMIVHMCLNMLAPGLLALGGVITLLLRASRSHPDRPTSLHDWIAWTMNWSIVERIYNPLVVFIVFIGSYYGLYLTPLFGDLMRFHWAHQLMNLHFLIVGYLYYSLVIGVDRAPRPLPHVGRLGFVLAAMPFHAFFGIILMTGSTIIAEDFYLHLAIPWADLPAQQYLGGGVAWAGGEIPLLVVIIALSLQWSRQDTKAAKRTDRHLDTGRDDDFDVYNAMLQRLAERDRRSSSDPRPVSTTGPTREN